MNQILIEHNASPGKATILLVSDDTESARIWAYSLEQAGMQVCQAGFNDKTLQIWADEFPDLILLEDHGSQMDMLQFCHLLRAEAAVPILVLVSAVDEAYLLNAYSAGADDCLLPPVSPRLFLAKVKAWLRRAQVVPSGALDAVQAGAFRLDSDRRLLSAPGSESIRLTNLETRLLYLLMNHSDWILETDYLVDRVWGHFGDGSSVLLKNLVYRLRRKIEPDPGQPRYLLTESNLGYRFRPAGDPPDGSETPSQNGHSGDSSPAGKGAVRASARSTGQLHPDWPILKD